MLKVGLTGGIGAGKSEVSRLLASYGAVLIDADKIAREVVEPGTPGLSAVVEAFGPEVLTAEGTLDRPKLGSIVFADPERLATLNSIVHPLVGARSMELEAAAPRQIDLFVELTFHPLNSFVLVPPYRVRIGRYASRADALSALTRMKSSRVTGIVVEAEQK